MSEVLDSLLVVQSKHVQEVAICGALCLLVQLCFRPQHATIGMRIFPLFFFTENVQTLQHCNTVDLCLILFLFLFAGERPHGRYKINSFHHDLLHHHRCGLPDDLSFLH